MSHNFAFSGQNLNFVLIIKHYRFTNISTMKRILSFTMALCTLLLASCEQTGTPDPETKSKLNRTSAAIMEFNAEGGNGEITYTIENPVNGVQVKAQCTADWIDGLTTGETVTFVVEENTSKESRLATIEVTYGSDCKFEVTVNQKGAGASSGGNGGAESGTLYFSGTYYGNLYSETYNYYVILHDKPFDAEGELPLDAIAYCFDLYSDTPGEETGYAVPNGTYTFDPEATTAAGTIADGYSFYMNGDIFNLEDATVVVSNGKLEATVKIVGGETITITYEGSLECELYSDDEGGSGGSGDYYYSNLTDDYSFNISGDEAYGYADFYGDWYGINCHNYILDLYENNDELSGLNLYLSIWTPSTATDIVGTYIAYLSSDSDEYTFDEGFVDEEGYLVGSWIATFDNGVIVKDGPMAPLTLGSITIAATSEEGVYSVTLNCTDDAGNAITGTFTSAFEFTDYTEEMSAAPAKVSKKATTITKKVTKNKNVAKHRFARR